MEIATLIVSPFETNCYLAWDATSREAVIIDPGDEADRIMAEIDKLRLGVRAVVLTHAHGDHIGAVSQLIERYKIPLFAGKGEEPLLASPAKNFSASFGMPVTCPKPERLLIDGDSISVGKETLTAIQTPGHSPGGMCYLSGSTLFCGDTLFYGSVGRTDFPGCSHKQLIDSIVKKLLILPDETVCYPGHGPATTIGQERKQNPFLNGSYFV